MGIRLQLKRNNGRRKKICTIRLAPLFLLQVSGHPRNNLMTDSTFLTVERLGNDEVWIPVATDADWETKYVYQIISYYFDTVVPK